MLKYLVFAALGLVPMMSGCVLWMPDAAERLARRYDGTVVFGAAKRHSDYLYEIDVRDYDYERIKKGQRKLRWIAPWACSGCREGNFHGRNLDWLDDETVEYVIRTPAVRGRHATLGIAAPLDAGYGACARPDHPEEWGILPYFTMDGINDAGLVAQVNIVPAGDGGRTVGTNPGKPSLSFIVIVRYLLDNAGSVEEALKLLDEHDVWGLKSLECHYLLSDGKESAVVEFVDNHLRVLRGEEVLTNFYVDILHRTGQYTPHAIGIERYARLKAAKEKVRSADGMLALMAEVWYSKAYAPGNETAWASEMNGDFSEEGFGDVTLETDEATRKGLFDWYREQQAAYGPHQGKGWHTMHTTVYDIARRRMKVVVRENAEEVFDFEL